jgi:hypothetical protein
MTLSNGPTWSRSSASIPRCRSGAKEVSNTQTMLQRTLEKAHISCLEQFIPPLMPSSRSSTASMESSSQTTVAASLIVFPLLLTSSLRLPLSQRVESLLLLTVVFVAVLIFSRLWLLELTSVLLDDRRFGAWPWDFYGFLCVIWFLLTLDHVVWWSKRSWAGPQLALRWIQDVHGVGWVSFSPWILAVLYWHSCVSCRSVSEITKDTISLLQADGRLLKL